MGNFAARLPVHGEDHLTHEVAQAFNFLAGQNEQFARELVRIERALRIEGRMDARIFLRLEDGDWGVCIEAVSRLLGTFRGITERAGQVVDRLARGDLRPNLRFESNGAPAAGAVLEIQGKLEFLVDRLDYMATNISSLSRQIRDEGRLGIRTDSAGLGGSWRELVESVNLLSLGLSEQVKDISRVSKGIASGDLSRKITVEAKGEILDLKNTINATVDQLRTFAGEVIRVAREVGTEGKLGGQAEVPDVAGTWKDLTQSVNLMASNLTNQVRGIARVVTAVAQGDLSNRLVLRAQGEIAELADTINGMTDTLRVFADQVTAVAREVGIEGQLGGQARVPGASGTWKDLTDSVNMLAGNLTVQVRNIAQVTTAVANGDLSKKISVQAKGEVEELKATINAMVDLLRNFASEVTRVAREVGTEGQLGGQASVPDVSGTWKDLTESVNLMASNLTDQVRGISRVVTAVANGDLSQRLTLVARGEIASLADTINGMTDTLRTFSDQVTTVAREVGTEGKLGGQAMVPRASGTWRDLTDNVNRLAANLTIQVRAISEVATAVTEGDLSRSITVDALGELLALKDTINQMISNLRETTRENQEQDWLKSNLAEFFNVMQGQASLESLTSEIITKLTPVVRGQHGAFYLYNEERETLELMATYAHVKRHRLANHFTLGEGLVGQAALEGRTLIVRDLPENYTVVISSGLGEAVAREVLVAPIFYEERLKGVVEIASFSPFTEMQVSFIEQLVLNVGVTINLIRTSMRTEQVLQELKGSNLELEEGRKELEEKALLLEKRNQEIAEASHSLEAKARELSRVSRYKSEFLANMSHEIRTPLNSMLILAQMLAANEDGRLSERQQEWAAMIHSAGKDLLVLINQVLDLSKVESGRLDLDVKNFSLQKIEDIIERTFRPLALQKGLDFSVTRASTTPAEMRTDRQLLVQILLNLVSNAFKFTSEGEVRVVIEPASRAQLETIGADPQSSAIAFRVIDTGIGIPKQAQERIFEAFGQVDGSITRSYEGTGLGLAISLEYARFLQGTVELESEPGAGSTFTLIVPRVIDAGEGERPRAASLFPWPAEEGQAPHRPEQTALLEEEGGPPATDPGSEQRAWATEAAGGSSQEQPARKPIDPETKAVLQGKKALVVEDDVRNLYATTALLESLGMEVLTASDATAAYAVLEAHPEVDVILMDVMMPEIDGYQAIAKIRTMPTVRHIPIVVFSAKASRSDRGQAEAAGADDFVVKPAEIEELARVMTRLIRGADGR